MAAGMDRTAADTVPLHPYPPLWRWRFSLARIRAWLSLGSRLSLAARSISLHAEFQGRAVVPMSPGKIETYL